MNKNIVLVGFMGAGKSLVAKMVAAKLNRTLVSTDKMIVDREQKEINDIFRDSGEEYFRKVESEVVLAASSMDNVVIDCGGGVVINAENIKNLKNTGVVVYLKAKPQVVYDRIKDEVHRPLLQVEDPLSKIRDLMDRREAFYKQADHIIDTSDIAPEQVCDAVLDLFM